MANPYLPTMSQLKNSCQFRIPTFGLSDTPHLSLDMDLRRTRIGSDDLFKRAMRQPKAAKAKKIKNISKDQFEVTFQFHTAPSSLPFTQRPFRLSSPINFPPLYPHLLSIHSLTKLSFPFPPRTSWVVSTWAFKIFPNFTCASAKPSRRRRRRRSAKNWRVARTVAAKNKAAKTAMSRTWKQREKDEQLCVIRLGSFCINGSNRSRCSSPKKNSPIYALSDLRFR